MSTQPITPDVSQLETTVNPAIESAAIQAAATLVIATHALTPASPTVSTSADSVEVTVPNTSGTVTFQLIVTDNLGTQSVAATATVEIQSAPTAKLTATPSVVKAGETITLSGAGSSAVAPGTIANYAYTLEPAPVNAIE